MIKGRPPRLPRVFPDAPVYFVTFCTLHRRRIGNLTSVQKVFQTYADRALDEFNVAVGRYVIMPDHIHLFVSGGADFILMRWVGGLKRAITMALSTSNKLWQPGFFDHVLRSDESYGEKWLYVRDNPVRAGLVTHSEDWPYQGEIVRIDRI
jgi:REP element-mobilizing transposase RayT